jgi:hypothetical protein
VVWEEILIGFAVDGFVAVLVPTSWWSAIFLLDVRPQIPEWLVVTENAVVAPFVAAPRSSGAWGTSPWPRS